MTRASEPAPIERFFQDIPDDKLSEGEQTAYLMELGWHQGSSWDDLLRSKRVLIISEAGAGKTHECRARQEAMRDAGEPAFFIELAGLAREGLAELFSAEEQARFDAWHGSQGEIATFFLDSIDELKLSLGSFEQALKRLARELAGQLGRAHIVITSRPIPLDMQLVRKHLPVPAIDMGEGGEREFAEIATGRPRPGRGEDDPPPAREWRNVALLPLSLGNIEALARSQAIDDPGALLADIRERGAEEFARRPQDLVELCADWREHRRIRTHRDQVASNIAAKLKPRSDRREPTPLAADRAMEGARKLALAATLARKLTLRHSAAADRDGPADQAPLDPACILTGWAAEDIATLLERPLFGFASYGRVRFHHRSVIEYLAAEQLALLLAEGLPLKSVKRLLFARTANGQHVVRPSLRPVAAWMAIGNEMIFEELRTREPELLLMAGDPQSLSLTQRGRALTALVNRYGKGGWRLLRAPSIQIHRFAAPDLDPLVQDIWAAGVENGEVREILIAMMGRGRMTGCADILYRLVIDGAADDERIAALDALILLEDPRLADVVAAVAGDEGRWSVRLRRAALLRLFPRHMPVDALCAALARVTEAKRTVGDISFNLPRLIASSEVGRDMLDGLRAGLTALVAEGLTWDERSYPHLPTPRPFLTPALIAICLRQLRETAVTREIIWSCVVAIGTAPRRLHHDDGMKALRAALPALLPETRQLVFELEDRFFQSYEPASTPFARYVRLASLTSWTHDEKDLAWAIAGLADRSRSAEDRAFFLEAAARMVEEGKPWAEHLATLGPYVADLPALGARLGDLAKPSAMSREAKRMMRERERRERRDARREAKELASWMLFWREVARSPDAAFSEERVVGTLRGLWHAMEQGGDISHSSGWNRAFIERQFGKDVADRMRAALMRFWRQDWPSLRSERPADERGAYETIWRLGLAGIAAEAEDPAWTDGMSPDEVRLALRYAPLELPGFPVWLGRLVELHPAIVDEMLGGELTAELSEPIAFQSFQLQNIRYAVPAIAAFFVPRLRAWLDTGQWRASGGDEGGQAKRLRDVLQILTRHGGPEIVGDIVTMAKTAVARGDNAMTRIWMPFLLNHDPPAGVRAIEDIIGNYEPSQQGPAVEWISLLFGDRHSEALVDLARPGFTADLLARLSRLAYVHVDPATDLVHEGSYSPKARDHAERGRGHVLAMLLRMPGPEAWPYKLAVAADPLFEDFRDRALVMAHEKAAEEADAASFDEAAVVALLARRDLPPMTNADMAALLVDRLDDLEDQLRHDASPRAVWQLVSDEKLMRRQIARELEHAARSAYKVDQERVTAEEKETDIRLSSLGGPIEGVIELKIGENWRSAAKLRAALREQIVEKYLGPETRRTGCLLVTVGSDCSWKHPETAEMLDFVGLMAFLEGEAARIEEELGGAVQIFARGLDLRPPLPTERERQRGGD